MPQLCCCRNGETIAFASKIRQTLITSNERCRIWFNLFLFSFFVIFLRFFFRPLFFVLFFSESSSRSLRIPVDYSGNLLVCRTAVRARHLVRCVNYKKQTRHVNHRYPRAHCRCWSCSSRGATKKCVPSILELDRSESLGLRTFYFPNNLRARVSKRKPGSSLKMSAVACPSAKTSENAVSIVLVVVLPSVS